MNILISAVGGQGALLASRVLGTLAQNIGLDVKISEVHGMSQRGGSVVTHVRFGSRIYSPLIEKGAVDIILAFEKLEGARYVDWLKRRGVLIVNSQRIDPMPVITGAVPYPVHLTERLEALPIDLRYMDALTLAKKAGNIKTVNLVLLGALAAITDIAVENWYQAIRNIVPEYLRDVNLLAFDLGYKQIVLSEYKSKTELALTTS